MTFVSIIPMAFVMIAGPQILSAIFLATSERWQRNSAAYILGASISISIFVTIAFLVGGGKPGGGDGDGTIYWIVLALLIAAAIHAYVKREESEPPQWMGRLQTATPAFSFKLGFLLLGIFPTDILTSFAVGGFLAAHGDPLYHALPFIGLTLLFLAVPSLLLLLFGDRAQAFLPKARQWMNDNSWIVNEIVIALFIGLTISNLA